MMQYNILMPLLACLILSLSKIPKIYRIFAGFWIMAIFMLGSMYFIKYQLQDHIPLFSFIRKSGFWHFNIDNLSKSIIGMSSVIALSVYVYTIGFMEKFEQIRFLSLTCFFTFIMAVFVSCINPIQQFVAWEGMGLLSYLLISFWNSKQSARSAGKKAFIINRICDMGFLLAIGIMFTKEYNTFGNLTEITVVLLILAICGKSAQFIFYTWLKDAMEGPTPASTLIHAATMVNAGIILILRYNHIFIESKIATILLLFIGGITMIYTAVLAIFENDIKKIIAFSTCSQLGFMIVACSVQAYNLALFYLICHSVFKALLFQICGIVIKASQGKSDIKKLGGLYSKMPIIFIISVIGALSLIGFPFSIGYFAKDNILSYVIFMIKSKEHPIFYTALFLMIAGSFLSNIYIIRWIFEIFIKKQKSKKKTAKISYYMTIPSVLLGILCLTLGYYITPYFLDNHYWHYLMKTHEYDFVKSVPVLMIILMLFSGFMYFFTISFWPKIRERDFYKGAKIIYKNISKTMNYIDQNIIENIIVNQNIYNIKKVSNMIKMSKSFELKIIIIICVISFTICWSLTWQST